MRLADGGTAVPGRNPGPHAEVAEPPNHDRRGRGCCAEILKAERGRQRALGQGHAGAAGQAGPAGGPHVRPRATDGSSASVSSRPPATRLCEPGGDTRTVGGGQSDGGIPSPASEAAEGRSSQGTGVTLRERPTYLIKQGKHVAQPVGDLDAQECGELRDADPLAPPLPGARRVLVQVLLKLFRFQAEEKEERTFSINLRDARSRRFTATCRH